MKIENVKKKAEKYLEEKGISLIPVSANDKIDLSINEINGIYYVEIHRSYYEKTLTSNDKGYPMQAEEFDVPSYRSEPSYRLVYDLNGKLLIDLVEIEDRHEAHMVTWLDDENVLLPAKGEKTCDHYRIKQNKASLIQSFKYYPTIVMSGYRLYDLLETPDGLYNFKTGEILNNDFNDYIFRASSSLNNFATRIKVDRYFDFVEYISNLLKEKKVILGVKGISVKKDKYRLDRYPFAFLDSNGKIVSDLYCVDENGNVIVREINDNDINDLFDSIKNELNDKIDRMIEEDKRKNENSVLLQLKNKINIK